MDSLYQRAINAGVSAQNISTMVSNAQKVAEAYAGSGSSGVAPESIAASFKAMIIVQIEIFEKGKSAA